eukprot:g4009.t1
MTSTVAEEEESPSQLHSLISKQEVELRKLHADTVEEASKVGKKNRKKKKLIWEKSREKEAEIKARHVEELETLGFTADSDDVVAARKAWQDANPDESAANASSSKAAPVMLNAGGKKMTRAQRKKAKAKAHEALLKKQQEEIQKDAIDYRKVEMDQICEQLEKQLTVEGGEFT